MRAVAWFLILLVVAVGSFLGYTLYGAQLHVTQTHVTTVPAAQQQALFEQVRQALADGTFTGTRFQASDMLMPESFEFKTFAVTLKNVGLFDADWLRMEIAPDPADVAQLGDESGPVLLSMSDGVLQAVVLTRTGCTDARHVVITYYVFGRPMRVEVDL